MTDWAQLWDGYVPCDEADAAVVASFKAAVAVWGDKLCDRSNIIGHFTPSCWIVNKNRSKVLMAYHNFMDCWAWLGGHADGNANLAEAALKEAQEESGISHIRLVCEKPADLSVFAVEAHVKKGKEVCAHLHYCPCYLFEAEENDILQVCQGENKAVSWIDNDKVSDCVKNEADVRLYRKIMNKIKERKL